MKKNYSKIRQLIKVAQSLDDSDPVKQAIERELMVLQGFKHLNVTYSDDEHLMLEHDPSSLVDIGGNWAPPTVGQDFAIAQKTIAQ